MSKTLKLVHQTNHTTVWYSEKQGLYWTIMH